MTVDVFHIPRCFICVFDVTEIANQRQEKLHLKRLMRVSLRYRELDWLRYQLQYSRQHILEIMEIENVHRFDYGICEMK